MKKFSYRFLFVEQFVINILLSLVLICSLVENWFLVQNTRNKTQIIMVILKHNQKRFS